MTRSPTGSRRNEGTTGQRSLSCAFLPRLGVRTMDCRWTFCVVAALAGGIAGCEHLSLFSSSDPVAKATADKDKEREARCVWVEQTKLKPETLVAYAKYQEESAKGPNATPADRDRLMEKARETYQRALNEDPNYVAAHLGLARLLEFTGRHDAAVASYRKALELRPGEKDVWYELSIAHARAKEFDAHVECLRKAVTLDPDSKIFTRTLGLALARSGQFEEGFDYLKKSMSEAEAHCALGRMLHHLGKDDAAREHARLALQAEPNLERAKELTAEIEARTTVAEETPPAEAGEQQ